jgi:hypothetical protein
MVHKTPSSALEPRSFLHSSIVLSSPAKENNLHRHSNPGQYLWVVAFVPANSSPKQVTLALGLLFLSCLVSELQKLSSLGLELRVSQGRSLYHRNLLVETNLSVTAPLFYCVSFPRQKQPSPGPKPHTFFEILIFLKSLPGFKG